MAEPDRIAAETWFLHRGLPAVLTERARWRRLWIRSAPALAAFAALTVVARMITLVTDGESVDIDPDPDGLEVVLLALLLTVVPVMVVVGLLVARITGDRGRRIAAVTALATIVVVTLSTMTRIGDFVDDAIGVAVTVGFILVVTGLGIGSVVAWAFRLTLTHLASVGALFARALPVVLLTVLVFFNGSVWSMATTISRERMWLVVAFMVAIAVAFLLTGITEGVQPMLDSPAAMEDDDEKLSDTPFSAMPDPEVSDVPSRGERTNVYFVVVASQVTQIATVAVVTGAIFITLGLLALSPDLLNDWTKGEGEQGTLLGMTLPISQSLIHVTMFVAALTFMYLSARAVGDGEYREQFLDPLMDDLRLTLVARSRYRNHIGVHQP